MADTRVGDTITEEKRPTAKALPGFKPAQPVVFCGLFPVDAADFEDLREAMGKLRLNDASFSFEMETSAALGFGFRCGFLGLLHLEIIQERLEREFDLDLIATAPSVVYEVQMTDGEMHGAAQPGRHAGRRTTIEQIEEPWIKATILVPDEYLGADPEAVPGPARRADRTDLCRQPRHADLRLAAQRGGVRFLRPAEIDLPRLCQLRLPDGGLRSRAIWCKMQILVNDEPVDALSIIVHRGRAEERGRVMCEKLKDLIPRHMFKIPIQAAIGGKVIARETISALRKDVTAKCYGGDVTRKRKLLDKQKEGKKKMRQFGRVEIPQDAFISALKMDEN